MDDLPSEQKETLRIETTSQHERMLGPLALTILKKSTYHRAIKLYEWVELKVRNISNGINLLKILWNKRLRKSKTSNLEKLGPSNPKDLADYIIAYEAWWKVTEERDALLVRIEQGELEAKNCLEDLLPKLDALERDYIQKAKSIKNA